MVLYKNGIAPWEMRKEYYQQIQLGKDIRSQIESINKQTKAMMAAQIKSTSAQIVSQDRVIEGVEEVSYGIEKVEQGIHELKAAFEWGLSEVVWQIEQNRDVLKDIHESLKNPRHTKAEERREKGEEAYSNGWIDDAEEEFLESEKLNKFNFSVHISLGMIYLFHKKNKDKALSFFEKAVKYAKPKSPYHVSFSLLYSALIKRDLDQIEEAEKDTSIAIELTPNFAEAFYQNAIYNAFLENSDKSMYSLEKAIKLDKNYCVKADNESAFEPIKKDLIKLFEKLRDNINIKCKKQIETNYNLVSTINQLMGANRFDDTFSRLETLLNRNSYFDGLEAFNMLSSLKDEIREYHKNVEKHFRSLVSNIDSQISRLYSEKNDKKNEVGKPLGLFLLILGVIVATFPGYISCNAYVENVQNKAPDTLSGVIDHFFGTFIVGPVIFFLILAVGGAVGWGIAYLINCAIFRQDKSPEGVDDLREKKSYYEERIELLMSICLDSLYKSRVDV
ncbi:MAG: hypothetical protein KAW12_12090 [Candidatus Aminicenantes bacterium]|nr:hypothetical protein [Candidatus Aminicenantes bacterium]